MLESTKWLDWKPSYHIQVTALWLNVKQETKTVKNKQEDNTDQNGWKSYIAAKSPQCWQNHVHLIIQKSPSNKDTPSAKQFCPY